MISTSQENSGSSGGGGGSSITKPLLQNGEMAKVQEDQLDNISIEINMEVESEYD